MTSLRLPFAIAPRSNESAPIQDRVLPAARARDFALRQAGKATLDFTLVALAAVTSLALEYGTAAFHSASTVKLALGAGLLLIAVHAAQGSYRNIWRYTSLREAISIAVSSSVVLVVLFSARVVGLTAVTGSTLVLMALLTLIFCFGARAARRWLGEEKKQRHRRARNPAVAVTEPRRVLIAGAGEHGLSIARDIMKSELAGVELVGFVDDDRAKIGASLNGARVLGSVRDLLAIAEQHNVSEVIVAMPAADPAVVRTLVRRVEETGLRVRAVHGIERFVMGRHLHHPGSTTVGDLLDRTNENGTNGNGKPHGDQPERRRVLVTGGAGFIGSHLTRMLLEAGYQVRVLDRFDYGRSGIDALMHPRLEVQQGDICSSRDVSRAVRDVDGVLALAAIVGDPACNLDPEETINLNYTATKILAETCNFYGVRRLVFASSCSVYGASENDLLTERSRLNPVSLYARTRVLSENIIFDRRGDVEPVVLRLATVFGLSPRMRFDLVVNTLTARAVVDKRIAVFGGDQWRPNVHCRDVARAFMKALEAPAAAVAGEIFNVGGNAQNHRIGELADMVAQIVGDVTVEYQNEVPDPRNYRVDFGKIRQTLGFEPEYSVPQGILEVAAAVRASPGLQHHQSPVFHNVQALKQSLIGPLRRRDDFAWAPNVASA